MNIQVGDIIRVQRDDDPNFRSYTPVFAFRKSGIATVTSVEVMRYAKGMSYGVDRVFADREERQITVIDIMWEDGGADTIWYELHTLDGLKVDVLVSSSDKPKPAGDEEGLLVESSGVSYPLSGAGGPKAAPNKKE